MQSSRCIEDNDVMTVIFCEFYALLRDPDGVFLPHFKDLHTCFFAYHLQLVDSCRSVYIAGYQQRSAVLGLQVFSELCRMSSLTCTLQTAHHDDTRRFRRELYPGVGAAHELAQFIMNDVDDLLSGSKAFHNIRAHCSLAYVGYELFNDLIAHVCFKERHLDFSHGFIDSLFIQLAIAPEIFEYFAELIGKSFKSHISGTPFIICGTAGRRRLQQCPDLGYKRG